MHLLLSSCLSLPLLFPSWSQESTPADPVLQDVQPYLEHVHGLGWSGTVLIEQHGRIVHLQGYGLAQREAELPCGPETLYEIASITKPITATAILCLIEDGKLALGDSIAKHLPGVPRSHAGITIEHLLAHTSGMPRSAMGGGGDDLKAAVRAYCAQEPARKPGEEHEYWNGGYALLAGIIEQVSGQSFQDFCRTRVLRPAGMTASGFAGEEFPVERQARGTRSNEGTPPTQAGRLAAEHAYRGSYGWHYKGMGGCVTHALDLWRFSKAFAEGRIVSPETVADMWTVRSHGYGLGWGIAQNTPNQTRRIGHGGDVAGFHSSLQILPEDGLTLVVLGNHPEPAAWKIAWDLEALLLGQAPSQVPMPLAEEAPSGPYAMLDGHYEHARWGHLRVLARAEGVSAQFRSRDGVLRLLGRKLNGKEKRGLERMEQLLQAMVEGDRDTFGAAVAEGIPSTWGDLVVEQTWPGRITRFGALERLEVVDVRAMPQDYVECWIALDHARKPAWAKAVLHKGQISYLDFEPSEIPAPFAVSLQPHGEKRLRFDAADGVADFALEWSPNPSPPASLRWKPKRGKAITWKRAPRVPAEATDPTSNGSQSLQKD